MEISAETQALLVVTSAPDHPHAERIAHVLVESHLAACVNLLPGVHSIYRWHGAVEKAQEIILLIKTSAQRYVEVEQAIRLHHPYEVPEIIAFPIAHGLRRYLQWIHDQTQKIATDYV